MAMERGKMQKENKQLGKEAEESRQEIIKRSLIPRLLGTTGWSFYHSGDLIGGDVVSKIGGCIVCRMLLLKISTMYF